MSYLTFLQQLIRNPKSTGAIAPSSQALADLITDTANLQNSKMIVELGSGTGVFTERILTKKHPQADFFALETSQKFVEITRKTGATVYHDSAINIREYLKRQGHIHCDTIISGLPFATFDAELQRNIMNAVLQNLKPKGQFLTFAYIQGVLMPQGKRFKKMLYDNFSEVRTTEIVWNNLPPAFVYHCTK